LDAITDDLISDMPQVQEHALEQERANDKQRSEQFADLRDVSGQSFDPTLHKTNSKGEPTTTKLGNLIKKGGGRKPKAEGAKSSIGGVAPSVNPEEAALKAQARATGMVAANVLMTLGIALGGEEWQPRADPTTGLNEKTMLENAMSDYFETTGKTDLPPSMVLCVAIGAYALPRFTMPKTQSRLSKVKGGISKWFINRKLKKHGYKVETKPEAGRESAPQSASLEA
jgi:hypothetical protein